MARLKYILFLFLGAFTVLFLHNAWLYHPLGGYDAKIHLVYTKILIFERRIPTPKDTPESYNPPVFYFLSGKMAQAFSPVFNNNFIEAFKSWQLLMALLLSLVGYFWYDIYRILNPKNKYFALFFLFWLLSLPVINKMAVMYSIEIPQLIIGSFIIWFFVKYVITKPSLLKFICLGVFSGIILSFRIMSVSLLLSLGIMIFLFFWFKKITFKKMLIYNVVFTVITLIVGGQYYYFYRNQGVFDSGENVEENSKTPFLKRQPKSFYIDTFFRTSMRTPIRPYFPNRFIPIFYSDFWGDYWNYYPQRRFGISIAEVKKNRLMVTDSKINRLAWQNRINFIPSLIIIVGMIIALLKIIKEIYQREKMTIKQLSEFFITLFIIIAFFTFFYTNIQFPNTYKGDTIKASYILYAIPCLIYLAIRFLRSLKKYQPVFYLLVFITAVSILFNLNFDFF